MGLFDSLFGGGGSHAQTTTSTSDVANTQLSGGDLNGPAVYTGGNKGGYNTTNLNLNIQQTDQGVVKAATDISDAAISLGAVESAGGTAVALAGLNHAQDAYTSSLSLVGDVTNNAIQLAGDSAAGAVGAVSSFAGKALDSTDRFASSAIDSNTYIAGKSLDSLSASYSDSLKSLANNQDTVLSAVENLAGNSIAGNAAIAAQVSQSSQQSIDDSLVKIAMYAALAVAAIYIFRK